MYIVLGVLKDGALARADLASYAEGALGVSLRDAVRQ